MIAGLVASRCCRRFWVRLRGASARVPPARRDFATRLGAGVLARLRPCTAWFRLFFMAPWPPAGGRRTLLPARDNKLVAGSPNRLQVGRPGRIVLHSGPQASDAGVHASRLRGNAPHRIEELVARENPVGMGGQEMEQPKLH